MKIIFDLDYTLLDTKNLRNKLADIFNQNHFERDFDKYFKSQKINFNFETYLNILEEQGKINEPGRRELKLKLAELMKQLDNYLFPQVFDVLNHFKDNGAELILLTFGDRIWQEDKVKNLSIKKYFSKIIFEEKNKYSNEYLKSLSEAAEEILIINDNARETEEMVEVIGKNTEV